MANQNQSMISKSLLESKLLGIQPNNFTFLEGGSVLFLGIDPKINSISADLDNPSQVNFLQSLYIIRPNELEWREAVRFPNDFRSEHTLSKEEILLRERTRTQSVGISSYVYDKENDLLLIPVAGRIFIAHHVSSLEDTDGPIELQEIGFQSESQGKGARLDPKCSPNGKIVSFIQDEDIWISLGVESKRLTFAHFNNPMMSAGVAEYIIQEEFDRYTGYWWDPVVRKNSNGDDLYRILYIEVDNSSVPEVTLSSYSLQRDNESFRYPRVGESNAKFSLKCVEFSLSDAGIESCEINYFRTIVPLEQEYPYFEYIVRVYWIGKSSSFGALFLDRMQTRLDFLAFSLDVDFVPESQVYNHQRYMFRCILREEAKNGWINVSHLTRYLDENLFVWDSEQEHGMRRLCLTSMEKIESIILTPSSLHVLPKHLWVNQKEKLIYFLATDLSSPLEQHLYCVSYDKPEDPIRLTALGYSHQISMSETCEYCVSTFSNVKEKFRTVVFEVKGSSISQMFEIKYRTHPILDAISSEIPAPEMISFTSENGITLYGAILRPDSSFENEPQKTIIFVYGGPHVQLVQNHYGINIHGLCRTLLKAGYIVGICDNRGSYNRGLSFETLIYKKLGHAEVDDQASFVEYLVKRGITDPNRVAVTGWSYGGYLSLMCMAQRNDVFKIGIAGAPVTQWEAYDTGYTERYMGTPEKNPEGYRSGSVLSYVKDFPDEENRVVIAHGLNDENVHFTHTASLIGEMVNANKPYILKIFPGERHGLRNSMSSEYFYRFVLSFLQENL